MKYQIKLTAEQLDALCAMVGNAVKKITDAPDKVSNSVRAIAGIDTEHIKEIKTKYRFVHQITCEGYDEKEANIYSEKSYDDIDDCIYDMRDAANTQHACWWKENDFTSLSIEDKADDKYYIYFEMYGKKGYIKCTTRVEEFEPDNTEGNEQ